MLRQAMNRANLLLRFSLELAALSGFAIWAWSRADGGWRYLAAASIGVAVAAIWGTFNVPGDPSRSGEAPVAVPGWVRLLIELTVLLGGAGAFVGASLHAAGLVMVALICVHYALSTDRIAWLLRRP
ncbi:uncharacterized protein DUF2568 [Aliiruegeria haliotis]|uniref:Uncharacterized protein DUF2568 n=1 Tax=Aliiruegeria haliotis TaxID=1280846 RepID=A0A2T0RR45_9RHOB|nr:YrdB family protein [Aliiruegeria haliotis]PRY23612.1 uncharacterized protein DUF2568 [Aliiruegeria haliotis]